MWDTGQFLWFWLFMVELEMSEIWKTIPCVTKVTSQILLSNGLLKLSGLVNSNEWLSSVVTCMPFSWALWFIHVAVVSRCMTDSIMGSLVGRGPQLGQPSPEIFIQGY